MREGVTKRRIPKMDSIRAVQLETGRVYRDTLNGRISQHMGETLLKFIRCQRDTLEMAMLERLQAKKEEADEMVEAADTMGAKNVQRHA
jgi:hypothetical protein